MKVTRREFLALSCQIGAGIALSGCLGIDMKPTRDYVEEVRKMDRIKTAKQTTSLCYYCSVTCGLICSSDPITGKIFNIEGDPDHPISEGALCAKGAGMFQTTEINEHRLTRVLYRAPFSDKWETRPMDWAVKEIAKKIKTLRDKDFITRNAKGQVVNRMETIAHMGSSKIDNEECWSVTTMMRALGLVQLDHQARV